MQISRNLIFVLAVMLAGMAAPVSAIASPAAIDQYTEQMPSGPGGTEGASGGSAQNGGSSHNGGGTGGWTTEGADGWGGRPFDDVEPASGGGEPSSGGEQSPDGESSAGGEPGASSVDGNESANGGSGEAGANGDAGDAASVDSQTSLPLVGAPSTPWLNLLLIVAAAGLLSAALLAYARRRAKHTHG
jgi:hypothetical protein